MALPIDYDTITVRGKYVYLDGTPARGLIRFTGKIIATSASTKTIIIPATVSAALDENGQFSVLVPATNDPDIQPNGWTYTVSEELSNGGGRSYDIDIPLAAAASGIDLSTVAPVSPASGGPTAFVTLTMYEDLSQRVTALEAGGGGGGVAGVSSVNSRTGAVTLAKGDVGLSNVDNTSDASKPVSTATQTALNAKANSTHTHAAVDVLDFSEAVDDRVATLLTAGTNVTITYDDVNNKVTVASTAGGGSGTAATTTYTPTGNIAAANVQAAITELDTEKAAASALTAHTGDVSNPHAVTKAQVGLGNVDNTSDVSKPVSTAAQTALDLKANATDVLLRSPTAVQVVSTDGTIAWLRAEVPYSSGDTNVDQWAFHARNPANTAWIKVTWLNGNYEFRSAPSLPARVGFRAFEMAESAGLGASNGNFLEASTNPLNAANREALFAVRGTASATLPGWVTVSRGIDAPNIKPGAWTTVTYGVATAPATTYETPATRLEPNGTNGAGRVAFKGRIEFPASTAAGTTLFTIADAAHRPAKVRGFAVRTGGGNLATIMEINAAGQASLIVASGASASWLYLDDISFGL